MSHNLANNDKTNKAAFFGVGEPAWHGLGITLKKPATAAEAIKHAGLDFDVLQSPVIMDIGGNKPNIITVPDKFVNYRSDNNVPLGVVGKGYQILQNREAFSFFDKLVEADEAIYHTAGALGKGEKIWVLAKLPDHIKVGKDDLIDQYVLIYNNHDGSGSVTACLTHVRVVCNNTLNIALRSTTNKVSIRHTRNVEERLKEAHKVLEISNLYKKEMETIYNRMTKVKVDSDMVEDFLNQLYPKKETTEFTTEGDKIREAILTSFESGTGQQMQTTRGTLFGLFNAVTHYTDHAKEYKTPNAKLKSIWFGGSAKLRQRTFDLAFTMLN